MRGKNNWQKVDSLQKKAKNFLKRGGLSPWYWNYRYKWTQYPKLKKVDTFPTEIIIETSSLCNLQCTMCFRNYLKDISYSNMEFSLFKKIIDEVKDNLAAIKLSWRGEVLLNKDFVQMVQYAKNANIKEVSVLTNATLLNSETSKELIKARLDQIVISVDGATKKTYESIRKGANFESVTNNIKDLIALRGTKKKPMIRIQITKIPENKDEIKDFINQWEDFVDEVAISGFIDYAYIDEENDPKLQPELKNTIGRLPCPSLWQRLAIMSDGTITVCCIDVQGKLALGNCKDTTIKEMWNSPKLTKLRRLHTAKELDSIEACRKCNARITYEF